MRGLPCHLTNDDKPSGGWEELHNHVNDGGGGIQATYDTCLKKGLTLESTDMGVGTSIFHENHAKGGVGE